ncbi:MAG TPA: host attachment protein [Steroidobacteraceae bacterium]|nr:host attachment protein [Steroidobacteraceae bacterium]
MIHALVADARSIRVFETSGRAGSPAEVAVLRNPDAGRHERDLVSDRPGRVINSSAGRHQAYEPKSSPMQHAMQVWLKQIGPSLRELIDSRQGDGIVLVAAPRMLASLRKSLPASIRKRVAAEVRLDLAHSSVADLKKRLEPAMAAVARKVR